jgi:hypothetical protein
MHLTSKANIHYSTKCHILDYLTWFIKILLQFMKVFKFIWRWRMWNLGNNVNSSDTWIIPLPCWIWSSRMYLSFRVDQYKKKPIIAIKKITIVTGTVISITWLLTAWQIYKPCVNEWFMKIHNLLLNCNIWLGN